MSTEIRVPTLGESVTEATIAKWMVKTGDSVEAEQVLCELETDKVSIEVPAPAAGTIDEIVAKEGETVGLDALLATLSEGAGSGAKKAAPAKEEAPEDDASDDGASDDGASDDGGGDDAPSGEEVEIRVPTLGESVTEATIAKWMVAEGDSVSAEDVLVELETDKVSVEVPAPSNGVIGKLHAKEGETVGLDALLATMTTGGSGAKPKAKKDDAPAEKTEAKSAPAKSSSGAKSKSDVLAEAAKGVPAPQARAAAPAAKAAPVPRAPVSAEDAEREERVPMSRLRQTIARRLKDAQNTAAMLTTYNEVDMTGVMELRNEYKDQFLKKHGVKLGFMSFFTLACVHALHEVPAVNAEIDGTDIVYKNFVHMGVAVGTPTGLVVPVVRNAQDLSFAGVEKVHQRPRRAGARREAVDGRHDGRHVHHLQRRRLWLPDVIAHPEPAAVRHSWDAQDSGAAHGRRRRDRDPTHDVSGAFL